MHKRGLVEVIIASLVLAFGMPLTLFAASLQGEFATMVSQQGLAIPSQAACTSDPRASSSQISFNTNMRITPASVSKLYTFDYALSTLPVDFRYKTEFVVSGKTLYINGGGDPHFVIGHLRSIIRKVHDQEGVVLSEFVIAPNFYFNWQKNPTDVQMSVFNSLKSDTTLPIAPRIKVSLGAAPFTGAGTRYTFESMPLPALLKQINDYSTNISADTLFARLGGSAGFAQYMKQTYGVGPETVSFATGSGLTGNYTTCALTLRVLEHLGKILTQKGLALTDILSMPTVDPGVLEKRNFNTKDASALVAKSGYVNWNHALAGAINTSRGPVYFAVFTRFGTYAQSEPTKAMIDRFVSRIIDSYRPLVRSFGYTPDGALFESFRVTAR